MNPPPDSPPDGPGHSDPTNPERKTARAAAPRPKQVAYQKTQTKTAPKKDAVQQGRITLPGVNAVGLSALQMAECYLCGILHFQTVRQKQCLRFVLLLLGGLTTSGVVMRFADNPSPWQVGLVCLMYIISLAFGMTAFHQMFLLVRNESHAAAHVHEQAMQRIHNDHDLVVRRLQQETEAQRQKHELEKLQMIARNTPPPLSDASPRCNDT